MKNFLLTFFLAFPFLACGYIPATQAVNAVMDDSVWFEVTIDMIDPENSVTLKDATINGFIERLGRKMAPNAKAAKSIIESKIKAINFSALIYDKLGYITTYKVTLTLSFKTKLKNGKIFEKTTSGQYDFEVAKQAKSVQDINSIISDKDRYEAIKNASYEALNEFISQLSLKGLQTIDAEKKLKASQEESHDENEEEYSSTFFKENSPSLNFNLRSSEDDNNA